MVAEAAGLVEAVAVVEEAVDLVAVDEEVAPEARALAATVVAVSAGQGTLPRCRVLPHDLK